MTKTDNIIHATRAIPFWGLGVLALCLIYIHAKHSAESPSPEQGYHFHGGDEMFIGIEPLSIKGGG